MPFTSVGAELKRFQQGALHSGSSKGPVVRSRAQAIAIALSEQRKAKGEPEHLKMAAHHALGLAHHLTKLRKLGVLKDNGD